MKGHLGFVCRRRGDLPSAPQSVTANAFDPGPYTEWWQGAGDMTNGAVTVSWQPPASDGGSAITGYVVEIIGSGSDSTVTVGGATRQHTFSGLSWNWNGCTSWQVSVRAINTAGTGPAATAQSNPLPNYANPSLAILNKEPEYGAPGLYYTLKWLSACIGTWSGHQLQWSRYSTVDEAWTEWQTVVTNTSGSPSGQVGSNGATIRFHDASGGDVFRFRVRGVFVSGGTITNSTEWSNTAQE